jgi:sugar-phosphatase
VATLRLTHVGLPIPPVFVTAEDVRRGKPDPEGYLLAAARLGVEPSKCVVVEDSPPGVAAGNAAGMVVVGVTTTHQAVALVGATEVIPDIASLLKVLKKTPANRT